MNKMIVSGINQPNCTDSAEASLQVENLSNGYAYSMGRVVSLRNVNISINKGEFESD